MRSSDVVMKAEKSGFLTVSCLIDPREDSCGLRAPSLPVWTQKPSLCAWLSGVLLLVIFPLGENSGRAVINHRDMALQNLLTV